MSHFDFWYVDRRELKEQGLTGFLKKFSFGQMSHFGPKNGTTFCTKLCTMKGANR